MHKLMILMVFSLLLMTQLAVADVAIPARNPDWAVPVEQSLNLFKITPNFYRSEQIQPKDLPLIEKIGIKTVVNLRAFHDDNQLLKNTAINIKRIRIYTWHIQDEEVIKALREISAAEKIGPVLLHCQHGADRTGLVSAMYRMVYQDWDKQKAIQELKEGGYGYHKMWENILDYLEKVDVAAIREKI